MTARTAEAVAGDEAAAGEPVAVLLRAVAGVRHARPALRNAVGGDQVLYERLHLVLTEWEARHAHPEVGTVGLAAAGDRVGQGPVGKLVADAVEGRRRQRGCQRSEVRVAPGG